MEKKDEKILGMTQNELLLILGVLIFSLVYGIYVSFIKGRIAMDIGPVFEYINIFASIALGLAFVYSIFKSSHPDIKILGRFSPTERFDPHKVKKEYNENKKMITEDIYGILVAIGLILLTVVVTSDPNRFLGYIIPLGLLLVVWIVIRIFVFNKKKDKEIESLTKKHPKK